MHGNKLPLSWEWAAVPLLTTFSQFCMKILAGHLVHVPVGMAWLKQALMTPWLVVTLVCEILSFALWMRILAVTNVSRALPLSAISYALIILTGWTFFHEPVLAPEIIGSVLIIGGVWVLKTA
ncbi:MAG: EamA family transporter [Proteobacteria bacterium]|nr:EamA family transporter [Pseudomonadota bacterium]